MKARQIFTKTVGGFSHRVLTDLHHGSSSRYRLKLPDTTYFQYKLEERNERIETLRNNIPTSSSLIYRGSEGSDEVLATMKSKRIGRNPKESRKAPSHDIVAYIRENDSAFLLSYTPCKETVKPYTVGLSLIPKKGYIFVAGYPYVFTRAEKHLALDEEPFKKYDKRMIDAMPQDDVRGYQSIVTMTKNNNEITGITGASKEDDWRSDVEMRIHSIIEVCGPGRILSPFMNSNQPAHVRHWQNPNFSPTLFALDIVLTDDPKVYEKMNAKAREMGLIGKDERLPTLSDACSVMNSDQLQIWEETLETTDTWKVTSFPNQIKLGSPELLEFMSEQLKSNPSVQEQGELRSSLEL